jgi:membrane-associated protein
MMRLVAGGPTIRCCRLGILFAQKSLLFRPSHLQRAHDFYEKYGGKTIIIARFVPIVRTFAPIVAGAAQMPYRKFVLFNVVGGFLWVFSMVLAGYYLGTLLRDKLGINLDEHIEWVVIIVVFLSLTPPIYEYLKARLEKKRSAVRDQRSEVAAIENELS